MSTAKQSAASRANPRNSTGPRTESGKAASRFNALKHGIDAEQQIMFTESPGDLAELAAEYHELHSPADAWPSAATEPAPAPQPEESTATSESPASFHTNPENTAAAAPKATPDLPANPVLAAQPAQPSVNQQVRQDMEPMAASHRSQEALRGLPPVYPVYR